MNSSESFDKPTESKGNRKRRTLISVLLIVCALLVFQAVHFELWYDNPIDPEFYGQVHGSCDLCSDSVGAYIQLGFFWPHSPARLARDEQRRSGETVTVLRVRKLSRFCTEAEVCYASGEKALLVSRVLRAYDDNGGWVGFRVNDSRRELSA